MNAAVPRKPFAGVCFGLTNPVLTRFRIYCFALRAGHSLYRLMRCMVLLIIASMALCSCATLFDRNPVPKQYAQAAKIRGIPFARTWGDVIPADIKERLFKTKKQIKEYKSDAKRQTINYLALSGGGANGAFGAGLLVGWTAAGD